MRPFLHHQLQLLQQAIEHANGVLVKYSRLDLDLSSALIEFLNETIAIYHTLNRANTENELLVLKAQIVLAEQGIHPMTLEYINRHRRAIYRGVALLVLQQSTLKLRTDMELVTQKLNEGRAQLCPIVLLAMQKGVIPTPEPLSLSQIEELWHRLLEEPEAQFAAKQIAMQLSLLDIHLLLLDLINVTQ